MVKQHNDDTLSSSKSNSHTTWSRERKSSSEKVKPGINFIINFPVRFNVSSTQMFRDLLAKYCEKNKLKVADLSREMIFKFFETENVQGILKNNKAINNAVLKIGETIKDEMGVDTRSFSVWYRDAFNILDNDE